MKKMAMLAMVAAVVIGLVWAGSVVLGATSRSGDVIMRTYGSDPLTVPGHNDNVSVLDMSFRTVRHFSLTVPAPDLETSYLEPGVSVHRFIEVIMDTDGDGVCDTWVAPVAMKKHDCGHDYAACYQFDAYGYTVCASNRVDDPWTFRVNLTMTWVK